MTNLSLTYLSIEFVCYISLLFLLTPFSIAPTRAGAETRAPRNGVSKAGKVHTTSAHTSKSSWGNSNALSNYWILKRTTSRRRKKEKLGRSGSNAQSNQACANHNSTRESKHMDASVCSNARQLESVSRRFGFVAHPSLRFNAGVLKKRCFGTFLPLKSHLEQKSCIELQNTIATSQVDAAVPLRKVAQHLQSTETCDLNASVPARAVETVPCVLGPVAQPPLICTPTNGNLKSINVSTVPPHKVSQSCKAQWNSQLSGDDVKWS